ncbi:MAG: hypothetical protein H9535_04740 [Ignavibacteria bacterium]|nr:hypothetical protein [Ignavibacteria bacterium]
MTHALKSDTSTNVVTLFTVLFLLSICLHTAVLRGQEPKIRYEGTIKNIPIRMTLQQKGTGVIGTYQYTKIGKDLGLEGELRGKDSLILFEYDPNGKQTGIFKGVCNGSATIPIEAITGVWLTPNGSKSLSFSVRRVEQWSAQPPVVGGIRGDAISGLYKRPGKHGASLNVWLRSENEIEIEGQAFWQGSSENINMGDIFGKCRIENNQAVYTDKNMPCRLILTFSNKKLVISGDDGGCGGQNVTFNGSYSLAGKPAKPSTDRR